MIERRDAANPHPRTEEDVDLVLGREDVGDQILVVSDLHLGSGRESATGRYRPRENFFADGEFRRFLKKQANRDGGPGLLVLNGDIIDLLRVVRAPRTCSEFRRWRDDLKALGCIKNVAQLRDSIGCEERRFGLRPEEYKSLWRVQRVIQGHREFFGSLGWWILKGGRIIFVKGNHDLELHWPLVQEAILRVIGGGRYGVRFVGRSVKIENVYIEHGHRFDPATAVPGGNTTKKGREISLPLASVVSRYLINKLEEIEPFLNNVKPIERAIRTVLLRHPWRAVLQCVYASPFVCRSVRAHWFLHDVGVLIFFGALVLFAIAVASLVAILPGVIALEVVLPALGVSSPLPEIGRFGYALLFVPLVPFVLAIAMPFLEALTRPVFEVARALYRFVFRKKEFPDAEDGCGQGLFDHLQKIDFPLDTEVVYGVAGHTHRPDVQVLERGEDRRYVYVNSGTWTPNWRDKRSNLKVGTEFSFLRFEWKPRRRTDRGEYRHRSLVWRDDRNGSVDNVILAGR